MTYALIEGPGRGWTTTSILGPLIAGRASSSAAFMLNEARHRAPVLPLGLFRSRQFVGANGATFAIYAALGAVTFLLVLQLQDVLHYSPLEAGRRPHAPHLDPPLPLLHLGEAGRPDRPAACR